MYAHSSAVSEACLSNRKLQGRQVILEILDTAGTEQFSEYKIILSTSFSCLSG